MTAVAVAASLFVTGCETAEQSALLGAAAGAVVGHSMRGDSRDALRGAVIGGAGGYVVGRAAERERERAYQRGRADGGYPAGRRTNREGVVESPYYPYNLIDVSGIPSGELVRDESNGKIFVNP